MEQTFVINIGRSLASGGRYIGQRLAKCFDIHYFDKEILSLAADQSGFSTEIFEQNDERKGFFRNVFSTFAPGLAHNVFYGNQFNDDTLFRIQSEAIRYAAEQQSCVFMGRCADYVLRDKERKVNIFVAADIEDRIQRIMEAQQISEHKARRIIEQGDEDRANFYNFYSNKRWGYAETYDLCVNSSVLGLDKTFELVRDFVCNKLEIKPVAELTPDNTPEVY